MIKDKHSQEIFLFIKWCILYLTFIHSCVERHIYVKQGIMWIISAAQKVNYYRFCFNSEVSQSGEPSSLFYRIIYWPKYPLLILPPEVNGDKRSYYENLPWNLANNYSWNSRSGMENKRKIHMNYNWLQKILCC